MHGPAREVPLDGRPLTVGRAADADVVVADPLVSRHHARLAPRSGRLVLVDLGSTNGTLVNGQRVRESVVGPGDRVQLGGTRLEIVVPGEVLDR
jgi:pSer/pThr/pTyr-binding forkhead associated (FHA) protein